MFNTEIRKINVTAVFAAYKSPHLVRRITPLSFDLPSGESYKIAEIRRRVEFIHVPKEWQGFRFPLSSPSLRPERSKNGPGD